MSTECCETPVLLRPETKSALQALDPARRAKVEERAAIVPRRWRNAYLRAATRTAPPRMVIKAHCLECVCWVQEEVAKCTATACPLWLYRPYRDAAGTDLVAEIRGVPREVRGSA